MKRIFTIVFTLVALYSCKTKPTVIPQTISNANFPMPIQQAETTVTAIQVPIIGNVIYPDALKGANDYERLTAANALAKDGYVIQLKNRTYILNHTFALTKNVTLRGSDSTVITRENSVQRFLTKQADSSSTSLTLDSTSNIEVGDYVIIYSGKDWLESTEPILVRGKQGNTLYVSDVPKYRNNVTSVYPVGSKVLKSFTMMIVFDLRNVNSAAPVFANIQNITFDGNKENNSLNLRYNVNMGLMIENKGRTRITNCTFINMPTECIVGHNIDIDNNFFRNNNGSIFHGSINRQWANENEINTNIRGNTSDSSNLISTTISGHSEGLLTTSNSGGHVTCIGNRFTNIITGCVIGALYPALPYNPADWGTSDYIFTGNVVNNAQRICYLIDSSNAVNRQLVNIYIANNYLYNVGKMDFTGYFEKYPQIYIDQRNINELPK